jgi:hypothetical protein
MGTGEGEEATLNLTDLATQIGETVGQMFQGIIPLITQAFMIIVDYFSALWAVIKDPVLEAILKIFHGLKPFLEDMVVLLGVIIGELIPSFVDAVMTTISNQSADIQDKVSTKITDFLNKVFPDDTANTIKTDIKNKITKLVGEVLGGLIIFLGNLLLIGLIVLAAFLLGAVTAGGAAILAIVMIILFFWKDIWKALKDFWGSIKDWLGIGDKKGKQIGGVISEEGPYMLHKGERVLSATEGGRATSSSSNTVININIDKPVVKSEDDIKTLVRELETKLQTELRRRVSYTY